ncbi:hydrogenase expression/formation C-terminal domain-containing protein, partial [Escherichia sp. SS-MK2]
HVWHLRCTDTLKGPLLESYEICPIPEVVLAAPEDLVDSAQRLSEVCQWLAVTANLSARDFALPPATTPAA